MTQDLPRAFEAKLQAVLNMELNFDIKVVFVPGANHMPRHAGGFFCQLQTVLMR